MPHGSRWPDRLSHRFLIPRYARKATQIIAVSETARRHVVEYLDVDEERVTTVHLGVDARFLVAPSEAARAAARKRFGLPQRYFFYCGQIYPPKNFGRLVQAYARVGPPNGISLVVAGTHTWRSEAEIALIDRMGLRPWVVETGWVERDALPVLYDLATALVMPSLYEACPSPILEAMAIGCPIVTSDRHGTAELAGHAGVLVDPEEVESIAEGMTRIIEDDALRATLVARGRERVRAFTWERTARGTLEVLRRAARAR
jgi:glycosyltransferase involved in cell wall biosynthesis